MNIVDFISNFAEAHEIQNVEDIYGTIIAPINSETYLVNVQEVKNR